MSWNFDATRNQRNREHPKLTVAGQVRRILYTGFVEGAVPQQLSHYFVMQIVPGLVSVVLIVTSSQPSSRRCSYRGEIAFYRTGSSGRVPAWRNARLLGGSEN